MNLLDEESDEEAPSFLAKVQPEKGVEHPPQLLLDEMSSPEKDGDREGEGGSHWRIQGC